MKRFTKVCLVLGILLLIAGIAAGGVSYGLGVEKDIRAAMNPPEPEMEERTIPGAELGRLEIVLTSDDLRLVTSEDGDAHIRYPVKEQFQYELRTEAGKIRGLDACTFSADRTERQQRVLRWHLFDFSREDAPVTVSLPEGYAGELKIRTASGDVTVRDASFGNCDVTTASGDVALHGITCTGELELVTASGAVALDAAEQPFPCEIKTVSGDIRASNAAFTVFQVSTTSGEVTVTGITQADRMSLHTISGDILVRDTTAVDLECKTISGDITARDTDRIGSFSYTTTSGDVFQ